MANSEDRVWDVVVVGGGAAGLSAGLTLARARRAVVVIDSGAPRNAPAAAVHGLLGLDGTPPAELLARGRAEVQSYGGRLAVGEVAAVVRDGAHFAATLRDGSTVRGRHLLIASGLVDELPDIPGVAERWGRDVVHCPYCHGWEVRDRAIGVLATSPMAVHQTLLFHQWSRGVRLFANDQAIPAADRATLVALNIPVVEGSVAGLQIDDGRLRGVRLGDGTVHDVEAVAVATRMVARTQPFAGLGIEPTAHPMGSFIQADEAGRTSVAGVWVAGNATNLAAQVGAASAQGVWVAAQINADLIMQDADRAVSVMASVR